MLFDYVNLVVVTVVVPTAVVVSIVLCEFVLLLFLSVVSDVQVDIVVATSVADSADIVAAAVFVT